MAKEFTIELTKASEENVERMLKRLLDGSRRQGRVIVKELSRHAAYSASKLTIPNKDRNSPSGGSSDTPVGRPKKADKVRKLVPAKDKFNGSFYIKKGPSLRKPGGRRKKRKKKFSGFSGNSGESRVMKGNKGELVIYTEKKISQKDGRFEKVKKLIPIWDKRSKGWRYMPTRGTAMYAKGPYSAIPRYFLAKQAWLFSLRGVGGYKPKVLNPKAKRNYGRNINKLSNKDQPSVTLINASNYAHKSGGRLVPRKAIIKALRGYGKKLQKQKQLMIDKAKRGA